MRETSLCWVPARVWCGQAPRRPEEGQQVLHCTVCHIRRYTEDGASDRAKVIVAARACTLLGQQSLRIDTEVIQSLYFLVRTPFSLR